MKIIVAKRIRITVKRDYLKEGEYRIVKDTGKSYVIEDPYAQRGDLTIINKKDIGRYVQIIDDDGNAVQMEKKGEPSIISGGPIHLFPESKIHHDRNCWCSGAKNEG